VSILPTRKLTKMPFPAFLIAPRFKLRGKIIAAAALVFTAAIAASLFYVLATSRAQDLADADTAMARLAEAEAAQISVFLSQYAAAADSLAATAGVLAADPALRPETYGELIASQLARLPDALGVYVMFDAAAGLTDRPGFAESPFAMTGGYFGANISRTPAGGTELTALDSGDGGDIAAWFTQPLQAGVPSISGPENYGGVLYTSFTAIIRDQGGTPIGMTGVSFNSNELAATIGAATPMGTGFMGVVNQAGHWVVHPDPALVGQPATEAWAIDAIQQLQGRDLYQATGDEAGQTWQLTARNVDLVGAEASWIIVAAVPQDTVLAASNAQLRILLVGGLLILAIGLVAFAVVGASIARPISCM